MSPSSSAFLILRPISTFRAAGQEKEKVRAQLALGAATKEAFQDDQGHTDLHGCNAELALLLYNLLDVLRSVQIGGSVACAREEGGG